ncbi:RNA polymerase sigma factor [Clostridium sp.]|uniref:RNA polymerase sigma factor n=1 Tax=Clostridium sp. TaxID=1506 RepID=UPI003F304261
MRAPISKEDAEKMYEEHSNYVYKVALFLTKSRTLADDITQDVFIQVWLKYSTYDPERPFKPWLYQIVLNKIRNTLKSQRYHLDLEFIKGKTSRQDVEFQFLITEEEQMIWRQVNQLSLKTREVIVLHYYMAMKLEEVAKVLDIPLGTCKSRLGSGLAKLRKVMSEEDMSYISRREQYE